MRPQDGGARRALPLLRTPNGSSEVAPGRSRVAAIVARALLLLYPNWGAPTIGRLTLMESLVMRLNELCDEQPFETSWYFKDLHSGRSAERNGDVVVPSASTRKIAILMAAL